jgi:hypothetical protein
MKPLVLRRNELASMNGFVQIRQTRFDEKHDITVTIYGIHVIHTFSESCVFLLCETRPLRTGVPIIKD